MNIFGNIPYVLSDGTAITLPCGVNLGITKRGLNYVVYSANKRHKISSTTKSLDELLEIVLMRYRAELIAGFIPAKIDRQKSTAANHAELPTGIVLYQVTTTMHWKLTVTYPDVMTERSKHTSYYAGTEQTHAAMLPLAIKKATAFRTTKLNEYIKEFLVRFDKTLDLVKRANALRKESVDG